MVRQDAPGQSTNNSLATLEIVHVADVNAPWFTTWFEAKELSEGSLFRPQIQISSGQALLEKVANSKSSIGLLSKSELQSALQLPNTIYSAPTGLEVCMALVVPEDSQVTQVGDLAVLSDTTNISATGDTVAILEALLGAYGLGEERTVSVNSGAAITSGLASGALALGALPVGQDHTSKVLDETNGLKVLTMTTVAATATAGERFKPRTYSTSEVLGVSLGPDATTVCDDIMIVAPTAGQYRPDLKVQQESTSAKRQAEPGGLIDRTRISLNELWNVISAQYHGLKQ